MDLMNNVEDQAYQQVALELENDAPDKGLWARAFAEAGGDEAKTKALYIKMRVARIVSSSATSTNVALPDDSQVASSDTSSGQHSTVEVEKQDCTNTDEFRAGPWSRWFARTLDLTLATCILTPFFLYVYGALDNIHEPLLWNRAVVALLIVFPLPFVLDAVLHSIFGNSLGKALLRIQVRKKDSSPLNFQETLSRNMSIWLRGYWCAIPVVLLIPQVLAYLSLAEKGTTSWDRARGTEVVRRPAGAVRIILFFVVFVATGIGFSAISAWFGGINSRPGPAMERTESATQDVPAVRNRAATPGLSNENFRERAPSIYLQLEPFTVNLVPEAGDQYLQLTMNLEMSQEAVPQIQANISRIRNRCMLILSSKRASELVSREGKELLAQELQATINEVIEAPTGKGKYQVTEVLFTSFVIQ